MGAIGGTVLASPESRAPEPRAPSPELDREVPDGIAA
jgi:hypothetical protein